MARAGTAGGLKSGGRVLFVCLALAALAGCSTVQVHGKVTISDNPAGTLKHGDLEGAGLAFITPATVTGQEEDRPALSLVFSEALAALRPSVRIIPLKETLSAINHAGVEEEYRTMIADSRESGLLNRSTLSEISKATGVRFIAQLRMASFHQEAQDRFSVFGLRMIATKKADMRVFLRIWDGQEGSIAWEGAHELYMSRETMLEKPISFHELADESARELLSRLP